MFQGEMARLHQQDLLDEASRRRLARGGRSRARRRDLYRRSGPTRPDRSAAPTLAIRVRMIWARMLGTGGGEVGVRGFRACRACATGPRVEDTFLERGRE